MVSEGQQQRVLMETENGEPTRNNTVSALDEDDDDEDGLVARVPTDTRQLQTCLTSAQGCLLLLMLKQHIKDVYGLSDGLVLVKKDSSIQYINISFIYSKIQQYSPSEAAKVYEKNTSRRANTLFTPKSTLLKLKEAAPQDYLDINGRRDLIRQYLDVRRSFVVVISFVANHLF